MITRYRCNEGEHLWVMIDEAIAMHDLYIIYECLRAYFAHVHTCTECGVVTIERGTK